MRRETRKVLMALTLFLAGTNAMAAQPVGGKASGDSADEVVRLTVEINWAISGKSADTSDNNSRVARTEPEFVLELTEGRVVDLVEWPPARLWSRTVVPVSSAASTPRPGPKGSWRMRTKREGRVRAQLESSLNASLVFRRWYSGNQHTARSDSGAAAAHAAQSPLNVSVERLPWDSLVIDLGAAGGDGIVAPGAAVPVSIAFNILWPDSTDVTVHTTAVMHSIYGGDELWRYEPQEVVPTNQREPPVRTWNLTAPRSEGTYVLEVSASWEPVGNRDSLLLGRADPASETSVSCKHEHTARCLHGDRSGGTAGCDRARGRESEVDAIDLARTRSFRPAAAGRSRSAEGGRFAWAVPPEALIEPSRRDKLRGWLMRSGGVSKLEPANATGLAWSAVGLKVMHPERPHRLTVKVKGGEPSALGVALIEPGSSSDGSGASSRLVLDACTSGPPILKDGPPAAFTWLVWPSSSEMVLVLVNRSTDAEVCLGTVTLTELDDLPAAPALSRPDSRPIRTLGLYLSGPRAMDRFGGERGLRDALTSAQNLAKYLSYCSASAVVLPDDLADRAGRRALDGQADEDPTGPDRIEVLLRLLARQECSLWLELSFDGPNALPGLPAANSAEAVRRGLVRINRQGKVDGPAYHALHPRVREAMKRRVAQALTPRQSGPGEISSRSPTGLVIRLGPGPTLLGTPDTGLDDATFERFVSETFSLETARAIPGLGNTDADRFAERSHYLAGVGRMPWLTWRSRVIASLYAELSAVAQATAPGVVLAVVTPGLDGGPAGTEARRVDRAGLAPSQAWRSIGLDLQTWPSGLRAPHLLRGVSLSTDALAHDLAVSPDLDALVAARPHRGMLLTVDGYPPAPGSTAGEELPEAPSLELTTAAFPSSADPPGLGHSGRYSVARSTSPRGAGPRIWLTALPLGDGPAAEELLGHAMAALDVQWIFLAEKAVAGHEEQLRRFAAVLRALPLGPKVSADAREDAISETIRHCSAEHEPRRGKPSWSSQTTLLIHSVWPVCSTRRPRRSSRIWGVVCGSRRFRLRVGVTWFSICYPTASRRFGLEPLRVQLSSVTSYPSEAVVASMQARFNELAAQLARLNHGLSVIASEPANSGFEPDSNPDSSPNVPSVVQGTPATPGVTARVTSPIPGGWRLERAHASTSSSTIVIDRDNPHSGQGSLKLTVPLAPASVVSETFVPNVQSSLMIQSFFRAAPDGAKIRIWIEGSSGGQPYVRRTEAERLKRMGITGGASLRHSRRWARLRPAQVRAVDAGQPVDRRTSHPERGNIKVGAA